MVLGTYWYFDFPVDLYKFNYFEFRKGLGGHADNPAELITVIEAEYPEKIIEDLQKLIAENLDGFLFVYQEDHKLKIGTGGHQLFDYDFLLIAEVEKLLTNYNVCLAKDQTFTKPTFTRLYNINTQNKNIYPQKTFLQIVGSDLKKYNAENSKFRLDCNVALANKSDFIAALRGISIEENIEIFFYYDQDFNDKTNLMLFFTNGRQGLNLTEKKFVQTTRFENKIEQTILAFHAKFGHIGGFGLYPQNGPNIETMIEKEFVL